MTPETDRRDPERALPDAAAIILAIGGIDSATADHLRRDGASLVSCAFPSLDGALLDQLKPAGVAFALFASGFDAPQLIARLSELGFTGWVCVITPPLPDRRMVERELRVFGGKLDLRFVETEGG